jgi:branched-chain amino acid transport system permease protein
MFLPGGIAGTIDAQIRRRRGERTRSQLTRLDDAADAPAEQAEVRA